MVRLAEWPRNPYLNEELHEWVQLHLDALGVEDIAVYALVGREDDERRILVVTEVGLLDGWYAPRGSTARFSLSVRLYPWQAVHGVDLRGETYRLWAHEHQSRWRLRLARPAVDALAESPELGRALTQFAAACSVMAEPTGQQEPGDAPPAARSVGRAVSDEPVFAPPPAADASALEMPRPAPPPPLQPPLPSAPPLPVPPVAVSAAALAREQEESLLEIPPRPPINVEPDLANEPGPEDARALDLARRLGLR
jgi:hypothetical protein